MQRLSEADAGGIVSLHQNNAMGEVSVDRIYLDHTATTPLDPRVLAAMTPYFTDTFGNASSVHWYGQRAKAELEASRATIARVIGAEAGEVFFTSGGTESDNLALRGAAVAARNRGRHHVITSAAEHHAVLETCELLQREGFDVTILPVDDTGMPDPEYVARAAGPSTCLVSIMHANNEVGTISLVARIAAIAHAAGALMHTDAVQTLGKIPVNVHDLGVDLMSVSAHKIYGPKGAGALYVRRGVEIEPLLTGGGQERGMRPGTENVPLAVGFASAAELACADMERESERLRGLRDLLEVRIRDAFPGVLVNGNGAQRLPHILNISFDAARVPMEGEMLVPGMDLRGIAVTSGSACSSGSLQPSHVLLAMGRDRATAAATIRFSFGRSNTPDQIDAVVEALCHVVKEAARKKIED